MNTKIPETKELKPQCSEESNTSLRAQAISTDHSVWFSANAGAGKTHILVKRILRLLLEHNKPSSILCLTFTRAACWEMKKRINERLLHWSNASNTQHIKYELSELLQHEPSAEELYRAQRLFYLCTNDNQVRVYTIHSFCEYLLRRFFDNLHFRSDFVIMDQVAQKRLIDQALDQLIRHRRSKCTSSTTVTWALDILIKHRTDWQAWQKLVLQFINNNHRYMYHISDDLIPAKHWHDLHQSWSRQIKNLTQKNLQCEIINKNTEVRNAVIKLWQQQLNNQKNSWINTSKDLYWSNLSWWEYSALFVTVRDQTQVIPRGKLGIANNSFTDEERRLLKEEQQRVRQIMQKLQNSIQNQYKLALKILQQQAAEYYVNLKRQQGTCDYNDLIMGLLRLLQHPHSLLHRYLINNINHILVDEAQDNNIIQWNLIEALVKLLFSDSAASIGQQKDCKQTRTIFITGDIKQSIYRFQGARLEKLPQVLDYCRKQVKGLKGLWYDINVKENFRTNAYILKFIDQIFADHSDSHFTNLEHLPRRSDVGWVELWPVTTKPSSAAIDNDVATMDTSMKNQDVYKLFAERVADKIQQLCQDQVYLPSRRRSIQPRDILILLRQRVGKLLPALHKSLQQRHISVHNDHKLSLNKQLIIKDWLAILQFLLLPEDDLNLAKVTKSFVGCWTDELLLYVQNSASRVSLWHKIQSMANSYQASNIMLDCGKQLNLKNQLKPKNIPCIDISIVKSLADFLSCLQQYYHRTQPAISELLHHIYQQVYPQLKRHFHVQAQQSVQTFLTIGKNYEQNYTGSLQDFVLWLQSYDDDSQNFSANDEQITPTGVHITTIHGAKGLEAPVVFVLDICRNMTETSLNFANQDDNLANNLHNFDAPLTPGYTEEDNIQKIDTRQQQEYTLQKSEWWRLLYVAVTRAQDGLILAGLINRTKIDISHVSDSWYDLLYKTIQKLTNNPLTSDANTERAITNFQPLIYGFYPQNISSQPRQKNSQSNHKKDHVYTSYDCATKMSYDCIMQTQNQTWINNLHVSIDKHIQNIYYQSLQDSFRVQKTSCVQEVSSQVQVSHNISEGGLAHRILELYCLNNNSNTQTRQWQKNMDQVNPKTTTWDYEYYAQYLKHVAPDLLPQTRDNIMRYIDKVMTNSLWQAISKNGDDEKYPEIKISGYVNNRFMQRIIDLLLINKHKITIIDYKYSEFDKQHYKVHLRQLQEYRNLINNIYPNHRIQVYILWIKSAKLEPINFCD